MASVILTIKQVLTTMIKTQKKHPIGSHIHRILVTKKTKQKYKNIKTPKHKTQKQNKLLLFFYKCNESNAMKQNNKQSEFVCMSHNYKNQIHYTHNPKKSNKQK